MLRDVRQYIQSRLVQSQEVLTTINMLTVEDIVIITVPDKK